MTEDEMAGWHHQFNGPEYKQAPGDSEGQGSLVCCSPWGHKEFDMSERLNNNSKADVKCVWCTQPVNGLEKSFNKEAPMCVNLLFHKPKAVLTH